MGFFYLCRPWRTTRTNVDLAAAFTKLKRIFNLQKSEPSDPSGSGLIVISPRQAGVIVNEDTALTFSAVWACVKVISETIAALPWHAFDQSRNGNKTRRFDDIDWVLHVNPKLKEKGMLVVFNPLKEKVKRTIKANLYYTGLTKTAKIRKQEGKAKTYRLARDYTVEIPVEIEAEGFTWFVVE